MAKIAIVTDSSVGLPAELIEKYNIKVVPNAIIHQGKTYYDGLNLSAHDFYSLLRETRKLPTTSGVSTEAFSTVFEELRQEAEAYCGLHPYG